MIYTIRYNDGFIQCDDTNHRFVVMIRLRDGGWFIKVYDSLSGAKRSITRAKNRRL